MEENANECEEEQVSRKDGRENGFKLLVVTCERNPHLINARCCTSVSSGGMEFLWILVWSLLPLTASQSAGFCDMHFLL